jgi:hypothetical protein
MSAAEAQRFLTFMKFPNVLALDEYASLLTDCGCEVQVAEDTGRFPSCVDLYINMLNEQLTYDALRILNFDMATMEAIGGEMQFLRCLAHEKKIVQGRVIAKKRK